MTKKFRTSILSLGVLLVIFMLEIFLNLNNAFKQVTDIRDISQVTIFLVAISILRNLLYFIGGVVLVKLNQNNSTNSINTHSLIKVFLLTSLALYTLVALMHLVNPLSIGMILENYYMILIIYLLLPILYSKTEEL